MTSFIKKIFTYEVNASITVEASLSFTLMAFILFLMLGPLLVIKTTSDILINLNNISKKRCYYEMFKYDTSDLTVSEKLKDYVKDNELLDNNFGKLEDIVNNGLLILSSFDNACEEYNNINYIYNINNQIYDQNTGIVKYDYYISFKLPYNVLHIKNIEKRLINYRRAFIGVDGNRFANQEDEGDYVYVANNYVNSDIYHDEISCSYLIKQTKKVEYDNMESERNINNQKYTKCSYCFRNISITSDTECYVTTYGDNFHYSKTCPLMTAYVTKIPKEYVEMYNLTLCSRCKKRQEGGND